MDQSYRDRVAELLKQGREADKEDKELAELLAPLVKSPGWEAYRALLEKRIQLFADALLAPAGSMDGAIALEFVKGTMSGLIIARDLPAVTMAGIAAAVPATDGEDE